MELWERFSGRARRLVLLGHDEAQCAKAQRIGTEHLLLAMLRLGEGVGVEVLKSLDVDLGAVQDELREHISAAEPEEPTEGIAFTPEAQKVLQHAYNEAKNMGQTYIGTEHLLVGLVRENRGAAYRVLRRCGVDLGKVRQAVKRFAASPTKTGRRDEVQRGVAELRRGLKRLQRGLERVEVERETRADFGRAVTELGREAHLDALVLVIGREGLETCLSTKPRHLRELLEYVKRLLQEEDERRDAEEE